MKILKGIGFTLIALIAIYIILGLVGPSHYKVERERLIDAPTHKVWAQISNFNNWNNWSPWKEKDPEMKNTVKGSAASVGHSNSWSGNPETSGEGSMTFSSVSENENLTYDLKFTAPWEMQSTGGFKLTEKDNKTLINWYDEGDIPFMQRPMMLLFFDLDQMMGPDFERGLEKIEALTK